MSTHSIPTTGIQGIRFRSRIEAQWAEMFTKLGWVWEYEPIELNGYIPDFIIKFPYKHLLVEVKGETNMENIEQYAEKIINSGWNGEFLLVCSTLGYEDGIYVGLLGSTNFSYLWKGLSDDDTPIKPTIYGRDFAHLSICGVCKNYTIYSHNYGWFCRNCGDGCSNKSLPSNTIIKEKSEVFIQHCHNCEKYNNDYAEFKEKFTKWCKENGISGSCPCGKFRLRCRSCNPSPYPMPLPSKDECTCCSYERTYNNEEYEKIYSFWVEAKNHTQWKGK